MLANDLAVASSFAKNLSDPLRRHHRQLRANAAAWADPHIDLLIAHLDDRDRVAALPNHRNLRINTYGPYRNRTSVGPLD